MLRSILPIWRSKSILMRAPAAGAEACGAAAAVAVADLLTSAEEEISGNAAAPSAAAMPSFRKLRRAGSLVVIAVSPFSLRTVCKDSGMNGIGGRIVAVGAARVSTRKRLLVNRGLRSH